MVLHILPEQLKCRKARNEVDKLELLHLLIQNFTHFRLILSLFLESLTYTDHDLAIPLLGIYQEEMKNTLLHKLRISCSKLANLASIPKLLTNSKIIDEQSLNSMQHFHTIKYYSAINNNRLLIYATT